MIIAVHIRFSETQSGLSDNLSFQCFTILAANYPEHDFIFIFDRPYPAGLVTRKNIKILLLPPQVRNPLLQHYWYHFKIPRLLNKYNVDHFISNGPVCSLRTTVSQLMIINDLSFLDKKNLYTSGEKRYLKKYFKKFILKASSVAVTNQHLKNILAEMYPAAMDKTDLIGSGIKIPHTFFEYEQIQAIKEKITGGKEYFLAFITDASIQHTILLLKAFSAFKKRQLSNMQLLLMVSSTQKEELIEGFSNYKYREEVKILRPTTSEHETEAVAAAYASIYLPEINIPENKGLFALANGIPLVTSDNKFSKSLYNEAALYTATDERQLAEKMMLLYKDENLRNELIQAGRAIAAAHSSEHAAAKLAQSLLDTATQTA